MRREFRLTVTAGSGPAHVYKHREDIMSWLARSAFVLVGLSLLTLFPAQNAGAASLVNASVGNTGPCLDVLNANISTGIGVVDAFTCNGTFAQQWTFEGLTIQGLGTTSQGSFCLDVFGNGTAAGTKVDIFPCNGTTAQNWYFYAGLIFAIHAQKCLDASTPSQVTIQTCAFGPSQIWAIRN